MHLHLYNDMSLIKNIKDGHILLEKLFHPIIENQLIENVQTSKKRLSKKDFNAEMEIQYKNLPSNLKAMVSFEYFLEQSMLKKSQIESALHTTRVDHDQISFDTSVLNMVYLLNLYGTNRHFNLWRYQADNFNGICLSLNLESIKSGIFNNKKQLRRLQAINYTHDKDIIKNTQNPLPGIFDMPVELESEKGWRLAIPKSQCHVNKLGQAVLKLKKTDIDSIIFGVNVDVNKKKEIVTYFKTDLNLKHINFQQLHTSSRHFEFSVRPIQ